ncbi:MAG: leucine--tRNA ligase [Oscillospiraceae bacterium]|jgi:leucyl-tRNA synthetase|nr:leucine--tRNA ligase [Oscillospiraceae bacterium]
MKYDHKTIERKWQKIWEESQCFFASNDFTSNHPKFYALVEFPYPSGKGLHVGHPRSYVALDVISRKRRMMGYNVLYPMGWDAFGLPTENFAISHNIHPEIVTENNIKNFKNQLKSLGISYDWNREINTTDPEYFKWTQWIFLKLFENNLAYKKKTKVNWCVSCKSVLANEEVVGGICERCKGNVINKTKTQWMLKITKYAQRLIDDLDFVDYPEHVKAQQKNWIGRSEGAQIIFSLNTGENILIYTTKPETIFGVTYIVLSPEHPILDKISKNVLNISEIKSYKTEFQKKLEFQKKENMKKKTGVEIKGILAIHPITKQKIPVFISDYVLMSYGTGSVMAVPGHDRRDEEFALKFNLPKISVLNEKNETLINSSFLNEMTVESARKKIIEWICKNKKGEIKINYKLRDWIFSRQRYWGEPIPIINCEKCGFVPIKESELPLKLPKIKSYELSNEGESPLSNLKNWVNTTCPKCGCQAKRETDTMPQWAGSSWYFLRYTDPHNKNSLASKEALNYWLPVDWYNGGMEHTTLHLLYSRFWHKFLYDIKIVPTKEPYSKRTSHGMILGENQEKMSKSRGNVVNPDTIIKEYGADATRLYEMFIGDFEKAASWQHGGITGCMHFLVRYQRLPQMLINENFIRKNLLSVFHKTIKKVSEDIENLKFNTAISTLMSLLNEIYLTKKITTYELKIFSLLLNPFAPHITEELWEKCKFSKKLLAQEKWPSYDEEKCKEEFVEIAVQINGKLKTRLTIQTSLDKQQVMIEVKKDPKITNLLYNKQILKEIYVEKRLLNIIIK